MNKSEYCPSPPVEVEWVQETKKQIEETQIKINELDKKLEDLFSEYDDMYKNYDDNVISTFSVTGVVDWKFLIGAINRNPYTRTAAYDYLTKQVDKEFGMIDIYTVCIDLDIPNIDIKTISGIKTLVPLLPCSNGWIFDEVENIVVFNIMERSRARHHSYALAVYKDTFVSSIIIDGETSQEFDSIEEAIQYIKQHHWYTNSGKWRKIRDDDC
jgi:hypothetical protein